MVAGEQAVGLHGEVGPAQADELALDLPQLHHHRVGVGGDEVGVQGQQVALAAFARELGACALARGGAFLAGAALTPAPPAPLQEERGRGRGEAGEPAAEAGAEAAPQRGQQQQGRDRGHGHRVAQDDLPARGELLRHHQARVVHPGHEPGHEGDQQAEGDPLEKFEHRGLKLRCGTGAGGP